MRTEVSDALLVHGRLVVPGHLHVVPAVPADTLLATTTLQAEAADRLATRIAEAGYELTVERRVVPNMPGRHATEIRAHGPRIEVSLDAPCLAAEGDLEVAPDVRVLADVEAGRDVRVGARAFIRGRVTCAGTLDVRPGGTVGGAVGAAVVRLSPGARLEGGIHTQDTILHAHPAPREGVAGVGITVLPDDIAVEGVLDLEGPVEVRPAEVRRGPAPSARGILRVRGDVRIVSGSRIALAIEATGDVLVDADCVLEGAIRAAGAIRIAPGRRGPSTRVRVVDADVPRLERPLDP